VIRKDGRTADQLRHVLFTRRFIRGAPGSCLVDFGHTRLIITATVDERVPPWMTGRGKGWLTAEYGMLPGSTGNRKPRPGVRPDGRSIEIQRLIGRALRQALDLGKLGERTITIDCDVIQADGGTRCAAITGGYVALVDCLDQLVDEGRLRASPLRTAIQAVSVGMVGDDILLDLDYPEDSGAAFDFNLVTAGGDRIVESSGSAEKQPLPRDRFDALVDLALRGTAELANLQQEALSR
jgi:ribonuclease PH